MTSTIDVEKDAAGNRWSRRPVASAMVRAAVLSLPLAAAIVAGIVAGSAISGNSVGAIAARMALGAAVSIVAFVLVERLARRFLPLAALLRLSLVFPDCAPSRFSVALRSTSIRKLQQWAREAHGDDEISALAEKVVTLASALNFHDRRTRGHSERSRAMADLISEELRLSPAEANEVRWGAFLHDIGKLLVPADILNKAGTPTPQEWAVLHRHPEEGAKLVEPLRHFLESGVDAVGGHHESYDGSGYPLGLSGEQIPLVARIVAVADSFEVMTAVRSYKRPMSAQAARAELVRKSGTQFDPRVVRAFLNVPLGRLHWALGLVAWVTEIPFLTVIPRAAAQVSAVSGGGAVLSTTTLSSIASVSLGAMVVAGPAMAHAAAASSTGSSPAVAVVTSSGHQSTESPASARAGSGSPASSPTQSAATASPAASASSPTPASVAGNADSSASLSIGSTTPTADAGSGGAVAANVSATAHTNAGGNGVAATSNAGGNGVAATSNAGGNGVAATSNAGGNGVAATSNAGGNGAVNSNAGGNGAVNSNAGGSGVAATSNAGGNGAVNSNAGGNGVIAAITSALPKVIGKVIAP